MSHNKGKHYIKCHECERKRYCTFTSLPDFYRKITCSKGHERVVKLATTERILSLLGKINFQNVKSIFDREDYFFRTFRK